MKNILCINYSQSGQLDDILTNFLLGIENVNIDRIKIEAKNKFAFPWKTNNFYDAMPETVLEESIPLEEITFQEKKYDLIILGYQPWFLSPSLPTTSLLNNDKFRAFVNDTPVMTIIGARNMWLNAHEAVVKQIQSAGGKMIGNIALVDKSPNLASAVSIVHWMLTGKKEKKWGIFPKPGVSDQDILEVSKFSKPLNDWINNNGDYPFQKNAVDIGAIEINTNILFIEGRAKKIFTIWAKAIKKKEKAGGNRKFWISFFRFYLNFALFIVAPIVLTLYNLLIRPFTRKSIHKKKEYFTYLGIK